MEIGAILIGLALLIGLLPFLISPFMRNAHKQPKKLAASTNPAGQHAAALSALRDLDFDYRTGKVSEEDYLALRAGLLAEAAQYIQKEQESEAAIETLIQARKAKRGQNPFLEQGSASSSTTCQSCGSKVRAGDLFCSSCGSRLQVRVEAIRES